MEPHCIVPCQPLEEDCRPVYQLIHKHVARHTPSASQVLEEAAQTLVSLGGIVQPLDSSIPVGGTRS